MTLEDLKEKALALTKALMGTTSKLDSLHIYIEDKEVFKRLHKECGEPEMKEPNEAITDYWFTIDVLGVRFFINYKVKCVTTYETL